MDDLAKKIKDQAEVLVKPLRDALAYSIAETEEAKNHFDKVFLKSCLIAADSEVTKPHQK